MADVADTMRWVVVYPAYLDSTKTVSEGRAVPKTVAVSKPTLAEITTCVKKLGLLSLEEPDKAYSRDPVMEVGRVRVQLKLEKIAVNPEIPCRTYIETWSPGGVWSLLLACLWVAFENGLILTCVLHCWIPPRRCIVQKDCRIDSYSRISQCARKEGRRRQRQKEVSVARHL